MPAWLGKIHPKYATPYAALIVQLIVSLVLVILNFAVAGVQEAFQFMLSLAVVLQLVPFLYMFAALLKFGFQADDQQRRYSRPTLIWAGASGLVTTTLGIALAFFPARQVKSLLVYETWMIGGTLFFAGLAGFFFFVYGRRKVPQALAQRDHVVEGV
jgi:amino acid transporter